MGIFRRSLLVASVILSVGVSVQSAHACTDNFFGPVNFTCTQVSPTHIQLRFLKYKTFGGGPTHCACALRSANPSVISSVDAATFVDAGTNTPRPEFNFFSNNAVATSFSQVVPGQWTGFLATVSFIQNQLPIDILVDLTVSNGVTCADVVDELNAQHAGRLGTDEADASGNLVDSHQSIVPMLVKGSGTIPTLSEWGLLTLGLVGVVLGTVLILRARIEVATPGATSISQPRLYDAALLFNVARVVGCLAIALATATYWFEGELAVHDVIGGAVCAAIVAYVVHLWILSGWNREGD